MNDWQPGQYLKFRSERTQPSIDLVGRVAADFIPENIIDMGCGPGNSTQVVHQRWPSAKISGIDSSRNMIDSAMREYPDMDWEVADVRTYETDRKFDLVFSNAVIQWIPEQEGLLKRMSALLNDNGVLAVQVPLFSDMPLGRVIDRVSRKETWNGKTAHSRSLFTFHPYTYYYDIVSGLFSRIEMWETSYLHEMESLEAIVDLISSTGMKPCLEALTDDREKKEFAEEVLENIRMHYPLQKNGKVIFPFKRLFFIAYKA